MINVHRGRDDLIINEMLGLRQRNQELESSLSRYRHVDALFKQVMDKVSAGDYQFDTLLNLLPIGVSICSDPLCREIRHNPEAARFLRIGDWEILSHSVEEPTPVKLMHKGRLMSPEEMPIQRSMWFGEHIRKQEIEFVWEDGVRKIALWSSSPLFDAHGVIIGTIAVSEDITERKQMEKALGESEKKYRELVEHAPVAIYEVDPQNRFITVNDVMCQMTGYSREELLAMHPMDILDEQSKITFQARIRQWLNGEKPAQEVAYKVQTKAGREIAVVLDVTFTSDEKGKPQVITGFGRDVTECKQVEVALHESERRYRELVKHAPVGIFEVDFRHKRLLSANDYMCQMSGYSREELLAMNPMDILDEQSKITFQARIKQWLNGEKPDHKVDYKVKAKDGRDIYAVFDVTCTKDEKGKLLGATVIGQDITKRKLAEIELNQCKIELELKVEERTKELIESNQKMTDILSSITDGFCVFDSELRCTYVNQAAEMIIGLSGEAMIGRTLGEFPNVIPIMFEKYRQVLKEKVP